MKKWLSIATMGVCSLLLLSGCGGMLTAHELESDGGTYLVSIGKEKRYFQFNDGKLNIYSKDKNILYKNIKYTVSLGMSGKKLNLDYKDTVFNGNQGSYPEKMSLLVSKYEKDINHFDAVRQNLELPYTYVIKQKSITQHFILDDKALTLSVKKPMDLTIKYQKNGITTLKTSGLDIERKNQENWKLKSLNTKELLENLDIHQATAFNKMINSFSKQEKKEYEKQIVTQFTSHLSKESSREIYHQVKDKINEKNEEKQTFDFKRVKDVALKK